MSALWQERRLAAVELRVDADLALGRHQDVVTELADLTAHHPERERFWAQRMLALYRAGRAAEALHCYTLVRQHLADELGVDPGQDLRDLHQAILTEDPALATPAPTAASRERRNDLPGDIPDFVGRADEFDQLLAPLPTPDEPASAVVITAIDGMAGIGKTTLAVRAAHRLVDRYPDAQVFLDLRAHTEYQEPIDPLVALDMLLRAIGVPAARIPADLDERAALWRAELALRKALLVLDNAAGSAQVRPLLPGSPTCLALITSRRRLADLDTAATLSLDVLPEPDALALFASVVGHERADHDPESTSDFLRRCGHLPLAIRIAGARLRSRPAWPVRGRRAGNVAGTAVVLSNLCIVYERLDRFDESVDAGLQALDRYRQAANQRGQAMVHDNLAVTYLRMGRLAEAMNNARDAAELARAMADRVGEAATLNTLGRIYQCLGDRRAALTHHQQALALAREIGEGNIESDVRAELAKFFRAETIEP